MAQRIDWWRREDGLAGAEDRLAAQRMGWWCRMGLAAQAVWGWQRTRLGLQNRLGGRAVNRETRGARGTSACLPAEGVSVGYTVSNFDTCGGDNENITLVASSQQRAAIVLPDECLGYGLVVPFLA